MKIQSLKTEIEELENQKNTTATSAFTPQRPQPGDPDYDPLLYDVSDSESDSGGDLMSDLMSSSKPSQSNNDSKSKIVEKQLELEQAERDLMALKEQESAEDGKELEGKKTSETLQNIV